MSTIVSLPRAYRDSGSPTATIRSSPNGLRILAVQRPILAIDYHELPPLAILDRPISAVPSLPVPAAVRSAVPVSMASHSSSFDRRGRPEALRTSIATDFFWPTSTTRRLPRVTGDAGRRIAGLQLRRIHKLKSRVPSSHTGKRGGALASEDTEKDRVYTSQEEN